MTCLRPTMELSKGSTRPVCALSAPIKRHLRSSTSTALCHPHWCGGLRHPIARGLRKTAVAHLVHEHHHALTRRMGSLAQDRTQVLDFLLVVGIGAVGLHSCGSI